MFIFSVLSIVALISKWECWYYDSFIVHSPLYLGCSLTLPGTERVFFSREREIRVCL